MSWRGRRWELEAADSRRGGRPREPPARRHGRVPGGVAVRAVARGGEPLVRAHAAGAAVQDPVRIVIHELFERRVAKRAVPSGIKDVFVPNFVDERRR